MIGCFRAHRSLQREDDTDTPRVPAPHVDHTSVQRHHSCFATVSVPALMSTGSSVPTILSNAQHGGGKKTSGGVQMPQTAAATRVAAPSKSSTSDDTDAPPFFYLLTHRPEALLHCMPRSAVLFLAGAASGAIGKTFTAPLDRVKILLQVGGGRYSGEIAQAAAKGDVLKSLVAIAKQDGVLGYWRGNLPQVLRVLPYSAMQLCSYELFKRLMTDKDGKLGVPGRLAAGACAGMASTLVTYPLDTLRLHMAVDPSVGNIVQATKHICRNAGPRAMFKGLGPALLGIAPYMALELAVFDIIPKDKAPSFVRGFTAALIATSACYPLDTVRRHIQLQTGPRIGVLATMLGFTTSTTAIAQKDGVMALYRGFLPNALKNLPNKGIRLSTFEAAKKLMSGSEAAYAEERARYKALQVRPVQE